MNLDRKQYKVLVIEDNPGDFALVYDFLFEHIESPIVFRAEFFKAAREILNENDQDFDVILLDLSLPDLSGNELITNILKIANDIPIIVLTGYGDFDFGVKSVGLGIADYILKDELTAMGLYKSIVYCLERRSNHKKILESEKIYDELFHTSPVPTWVYSIDTLQFLDVNNAAQLHYGYSKEEFLSLTIKDIRPAECLPALMEAIEQNADKLCTQGLFEHKKKNGELIKVIIRTNFIVFKGVNAKVVTAIDITERQRYMEAIEKQNEKLTEISWIHSHLVRAPVARILGLTGLIEAELVDEAELQMCMDGIVASAKELDCIVKDISAKATSINSCDM